MKQYKTKKGFVLVEWMVQFMLLTILSIISYTLIAMWYKTISRTHHLITELLPVHLALDVMRSDIAQGDPEKIRIDGNKLYLMHSHKHIQWYLNEQKLFRISGAYDQQKKRWRKSVKSLVANKLHTGTFAQKHANAKNEKQEIRIKLHSIHKPQPIEQLIIVRNGYTV